MRTSWSCRSRFSQKVQLTLPQGSQETEMFALDSCPTCSLVWLKPWEPFDVFIEESHFFTHVQHQNGNLFAGQTRSPLFAVRFVHAWIFTRRPSQHISTAWKLRRTCAHLDRHFRTCGISPTCSESQFWSRCRRWFSWCIQLFHITTLTIRLPHLLCHYLSSEKSHQPKLRDVRTYTSQSISHEIWATSSPRKPHELRIAFSEAWTRKSFQGRTVSRCCFQFTRSPGYELDVQQSP